ncbi:MAG: hypothetical protein U0521_17595 [Anaerolineae bacterium]
MTRWRIDPGDTQGLRCTTPSTCCTTPGNLAGGLKMANKPVLTFWHQRDLRSGANFSVEMWTSASGWDPIGHTTAPTPFRNRRLGAGRN